MSIKEGVLHDLCDITDNWAKHDYWDPVTRALYSPRGDYCFQIQDPGSITHAALIYNTFLPLRKVVSTPAGIDVLLPGVTTADPAGTNLGWIGYQNGRPQISEGSLTLRLPYDDILNHLREVNGIAQIHLLLRNAPTLENVSEIISQIMTSQFAPVPITWHSIRKAA